MTSISLSIKTTFFGYRFGYNYNEKYQKVTSFSKAFKKEEKAVKISEIWEF